MMADKSKQSGPTLQTPRIGETPSIDARVEATVFK